MKQLARLLLMSPLLVIAVSVQADWRPNITEDQMTGEVNAYANSDIVMAKKRMGFPYSDTKAWLGVGCDTNHQWAYVGFNGAPNLNDTETKDGYNRIRTRIRWDDSVENVTLYQEWGDRFLGFAEDESAIRKITQSNTVLLEFNWHGEGSTYFQFSLDGSAAAVAKIRSECGLD